MRTLIARRAVTIALSLLMLAMLAPVAVTQGADSDAPVAKPGPELTARERALIEMLSGSKLTGSFTTVGGKQPDKLHKESYTIIEVSKIQDNLFLFRARIQYGERDVTLPMPLPVIWSGDTPVITLTNAAIPGLGTFSARVLFHEGKYAGTWRHGKHHGHLFGDVEPLNDTDAKTSGDAPSK